MDTHTAESEKPDDLCRQMQDVRCSLGDDVEGIVESVRTLADWRHYVRQYPWLCLAGAAAVGFLIVPKRVEIVSPDADTLERLAARNKLVVQKDPTPQAKSGISGALLGLLANAAIRGAMGYVGQNAGKLFAGSSEMGGENAKSHH